MRYQTLVRRYTQGLINSIKNEKEFTTLHQELEEFSRLLSEQESLRSVLKSRFFPTKKKSEVAEEILEKASFHGKSSRFLLLLVEHDRLALLPDILEYMPELWSEGRGISTFEVSSVVPLSDGQKRRLEQKLERLERRPVFLKYKKDPSLIGGLSIRQKNIVYDASLRGQLARIKEIISEG